VEKMMCNRIRAIAMVARFAWSNSRLPALRIINAWIEAVLRDPDALKRAERGNLFSSACRPACYAAHGDAAGRPGIRHHRLFRQDAAMRVRVDHGADAIYLNLTDRAIKVSAEVADGIVVDYDAEGRIVGVEILDASKRTDDPEVLKQFSFELPTVG
jgi:uncharacterized protein YuzE